MRVCQRTAARGVQSLTGKRLNILDALHRDFLVTAAGFFQYSIVSGRLQPRSPFVLLAISILHKRGQRLSRGFQLDRHRPGVHPGGVLSQKAPLVLPHPALQITPHLADLVPGVLLSTVGHTLGVQRGQPRFRVIRYADARPVGVEIVPAIPPAQPRSGAVAGGLGKVLVPHAVQCDGTTYVVNLPLPHGVARAGALVGCHLHKFAAQLLHAGQLQLGGGLVHAGQHTAAHCSFQRVPVAGGVGDILHAVGQVVHGPADGSVVVYRPGADLQPGPVKALFQLAGHGGSRRGRQVLPAAQGLAVSGVQKIQQGGGFIHRHRVFARRAVDGIIGGQCRRARLGQQAAYLAAAALGVLSQRVDSIVLHRAQQFHSLRLPDRCLGHAVRRCDAPGNVPQDVVLDLPPQAAQRVRQLCQILRPQHHAPPKVSVSPPPFSASAAATMAAASSSV